jgi:hypothetical protein
VVLCIGGALIVAMAYFATEGDIAMAALLLFVGAVAFGVLIVVLECISYAMRRIVFWLTERD